MRGRGPKGEGGKKAQPKGVQRLRDVLGPLLGKRIYGRPMAMGAFRAAWSKAAGERVSRATHVRNFRDGTLIIEVGSAALRYELEAFTGATILSALRADETIPEVRRLTFRAGNTEA